jgi:hypothetical protein
MIGTRLLKERQTMIPRALRERLEKFVDEHDACDHDGCPLVAVHRWLNELLLSPDPEHEVLLVGLAYQSLVAQRLLKEEESFPATAATPRARTLS